MSDKWFDKQQLPFLPNQTLSKLVLITLFKHFHYLHWTLNNPHCCEMIASENINNKKPTNQNKRGKFKLVLLVEKWKQVNLEMRIMNNSAYATQNHINLDIILRWLILLVILPRRNNYNGLCVCYRSFSMTNMYILPSVILWLICINCPLNVSCTNVY